MNLFIDDMVGDGTTADSIKLTLSNIKESTDELTTVLQDLTRNVTKCYNDDLKRPKLVFRRSMLIFRVSKA